MIKTTMKMLMKMPMKKIKKSKMVKMRNRKETIQSISMESSGKNFGKNFKLGFIENFSNRLKLA